MDGLVAFRDEHIDLQSLPLDVLDIEVIDFVLEGELSLVDWPESLSYLGSLSVVVVEIGRDEGD